MKIKQQLIDVLTTCSEQQQQQNQHHQQQSSKLTLKKKRNLRSPTPPQITSNNNNILLTINNSNESKMTHNHQTETDTNLNIDSQHLSQNVDSTTSCISDELIDNLKQTRSFGVSTDTSDLPQCEPGTSILLEGIIWNETNKGVLILNVTWRGKTFVGSLIDTSKTSWAPPRFKEIPKFKTSTCSSTSSSASSSSSTSASCPNPFVKDPFSYYGNYGPASSLYNDTPFTAAQPTSSQNGLSADPTVRTLRNGKRRYINRFENDLMSDIEFDLCNNSTHTPNTTPVTNNTLNHKIESNQLNSSSSKIKTESHSSASSVNEEEFDNMTQSSTGSTASSGKSSTKAGGKKAKNNGNSCNNDNKSISSSSSSCSTSSTSSQRSYKKSRKSCSNDQANLANLDDSSVSVSLNGRHTPRLSGQIVDLNEAKT